MYLHSKMRTDYLAKSTLTFALLFAGTLLAGCPPPPVALPDGGDEVDPGLDPQGLFETTVKPILVNAGCQGCHAIQQMTVAPFLVPDDEYNSITKYNMGSFLTTVANQSLLLNKGAHQGPALTSEQKTPILAWLEGEALTRGAGGNSPTTPTVAIRAGDFYINLQSLVDDPLAKITFTLSAFGTRSYRVTNLQLTAGPESAIHVKHPRFIIFSATGATADPSDALSTVEMTTPGPSTTVTLSNGLLLDNLPASTARLALAFQTVEKTGPMGMPPTCKNYDVFKASVKNRLAACSTQCHSATALDTSRRSQATGAFNMAAANGTVEADIQQLCIYALGRLNLTDLSKSVLLLQPEPQTLGGTPNHPYKFSDTAFPAYSMDVTTWGNGEK